MGTLGGKRPGAGSKAGKVKHVMVLRETQPGRYEQIEEATDADLTPLAVMADNMGFFHGARRELMAVIMAMPRSGRRRRTPRCKRCKTWPACCKCER